MGSAGQALSFISSVLLFRSQNLIEIMFTSWLKSDPVVCSESIENIFAENVTCSAFDQ